MSTQWRYCEVFSAEGWDLVLGCRRSMPGFDPERTSYFKPVTGHTSGY